MTLAELRDKEPPDSLPKLGSQEYSLLWDEGFWAGAISDMLSCRGQEYWFEMIQENEAPTEGQWYRRYALVKLTTQQLYREHKVHEDFRRHVGTHHDYREDGGSLRPQDQWHLFYDEHLDYCRSQRFEQSEVIAWFEL